MIKKLFLFAIVLSFFAVACNESGTKKADKGDDGFVSEESLGLRKTDLYSESSTEGDLGVFDAPAAGQSENIERSFENAPPLIPHTNEGFLPITRDMNLCLSCHMPNVAKDIQATAIPTSHFMNFRPQTKEQGGKVVLYSDNEKGNSVTMESLGEHLSYTRYNCTQCHVSQADITVEVKNTFVADFRDENSKSKSNFADVVDEGVNK